MPFSVRKQKWAVNVPQPRNMVINQILLILGNGLAQVGFSLVLFGSGLWFSCKWWWKKWDRGGGGERMLTGRRWVSFLWAPLAPEQPLWVFKGPLPTLWAVLQPTPQGCAQADEQSGCSRKRREVLGSRELYPSPPPPATSAPYPWFHVPAPRPQCSPQPLRKEKAGGWVKGEKEEELGQCTQEPLGREGLIYTFRTTQHHRTLWKEGEIPLCVYMVFLDSLFWLTLWLHYNSGPFKYTAIITKITGLLWLYFSLVN